MTFEIALVLAILGAALVLFVSERLPPDLVALLVLVALAVGGLVTPAEALAGFSSPAVVTVWAMFVLSGALQRTGVAAAIGRRVRRWAGSGEARLVAVIMLVSGVLSAFMNNVGVAAMMLPVVMDLARRTQRPPSRLLLPLAYGCLLGGLSTLIGTPPNILVSDALAAADREPFALLDFAPTGVPILAVGTLFMALVGRRLLPERDAAREAVGRAGAAPGVGVWGLEDRIFSIRIPVGSALDGVPLGRARLLAALGWHVLALERGGQRSLSPGLDQTVAGGDRLVVSGKREALNALRAWGTLAELDAGAVVAALSDARTALGEVVVGDAGPWLERTLRQLQLRAEHRVTVLAIDLPERPPRRADLQDIPLAAGSRLLVSAHPEALETLAQTESVAEVRTLDARGAEARWRLSARLQAVPVPEGSTLDGASLRESRLGDAFDLLVVGLRRGDEMRTRPRPDERLRAGDVLLIQGRREDLRLLGALQGLVIEEGERPRRDALSDELAGFGEAVVAPDARIAGRTPRELGIADRRRLRVLGLLRGGDLLTHDLQDEPLRRGDLLLLHGTWRDLALLGSEPDFVVLSEAAQPPPRLEKAPWAVAVMAATLAPALLGVLPIAVAAVGGAAAMVLVGCLSMDEAYRDIEWRAVFLIAGLLPMGVAMENTGAAAWVADGAVATLAPLGWPALAAGLFLLANLSTQIMPNPAVAVLMAPIAIGAADGAGISAHTLMMAVAIGASAAVMSPVGHPANVLVMAPGGYRFRDYLRVGLPLTLIVLLVTMLVLPLAWPPYGG